MATTKSLHESLLSSIGSAATSALPLVLGLLFVVVTRRQVIGALTDRYATTVPGDDGGNVPDSRVM